MKTIMEKTTREEQRIAKSFVESYRNSAVKAVVGEKNFVKIKVEGEAEYRKIPKKVLSMMSAILKDMAEGRSITLLASDTELSTQEAADMLNLSRPHLVKMLEAGNIPFNKVGVHRRVKLGDLVLFNQKIKEERKKNLAFLTKQAQDLNLGY